jgi:hypothetical protein
LVDEDESVRALRAGFRYPRSVELHADQLVSAAYRAGSILEYERNVLAVVGTSFRADAALIVREHGPGSGASGVRAEIARLCRTRWPLYGELKAYAQTLSRLSRYAECMRQLHFEQRASGA